MSDLCLTINSIACKELDSGYEENLSNSGQNTAKRKIVCAWANAVALETYLRNANNFTVGGFNFVVGQQHPRYTSMYVDSVSVSPETPTWQHAVLELSYKTLQFDPEAPAAIREETITPAAELIPIPASGFDFDDDSKPDEDEHLLMQTLRYSVKLYHVRVLPLGAMLNCQNKASASSMTIKLGGSATVSVSGDKVVYEGPSDISRRITTAGAEDWTCTHNFLIRPISFNAIYNPARTDTNILDRFEVPANGKKYATANMSTLGV